MSVRDAKVTKVNFDKKCTDRFYHNFVFSAFASQTTHCAKMNDQLSIVYEKTASRTDKK